MLKLEQIQIDSFEKVTDRSELCEKIYHYIQNNNESFKEYQIDFNQLKPNVYKSYDLLISLLLTDNDVISQLIVWNTILKKDVLLSTDIQAFIYKSNVRAKDLLSVLEYSEIGRN